MGTKPPMLERVFQGRPKTAHAVFDFTTLASLLALGGCGLYFGEQGHFWLPMGLFALAFANFAMVNFVVRQAMRSRTPPSRDPQRQE